MRKFALSGLLVSAAYLATTVAGAGVVPPQGTRRTPKGVGDPIVIGDCRLAVINKQDVPSQRSGQVKWLGVAELEKMSDGTYRYLDKAKHKEPVPPNREYITVQVDIMPGQKPPDNQKVFTRKNGG